MHSVLCVSACWSPCRGGKKKSRVRQDAETTVSIVQSVIQSVSKSVNSLADGSFELSSKRNSLSPWCIISACALFPTVALLQSKEVGLPSIQIFSFVPMFSRHVRVRYVCVCVCLTVLGCESVSLRLYERACACWWVLCQFVCLFMCVMVYAQ